MRRRREAADEAIVPIVIEVEEFHPRGRRRHGRPRDERGGDGLGGEDDADHTPRRRRWPWFAAAGVALAVAIPAAVVALTGDEPPAPIPLDGAAFPPSDLPIPFVTLDEAPMDYHLVGAWTSTEPPLPRGVTTLAVFAEEGATQRSGRFVRIRLIPDEPGGTAAMVTGRSTSVAIGDRTGTLVTPPIDAREIHVELGDRTLWVDAMGLSSEEVVAITTAVELRDDRPVLTEPRLVEGLEQIMGAEVVDWYAGALARTTSYATYFNQREPSWITLQAMTLPAEWDFLRWMQFVGGGGSVEPVRARPAVGNTVGSTLPAFVAWVEGNVGFAVSAPTLALDELHRLAGSVRFVPPDEWEQMRTGSQPTTIRRLTHHGQVWTVDGVVDGRTAQWCVDVAGDEQNCWSGTRLDPELATIEMLVVDRTTVLVAFVPHDTPGLVLRAVDDTGRLIGEAAVDVTLRDVDGVVGAIVADLPDAWHAEVLDADRRPLATLRMQGGGPVLATGTAAG